MPVDKIWLCKQLLSINVYSFDIYHHQNAFNIDATLAKWLINQRESLSFFLMLNSEKWRNLHSMPSFLIVCYAMVWYDMVWNVWYAMVFLCYEIWMLCYAMVYDVKDKHSATVTHYLFLCFLLAGSNMIPTWSWRDFINISRSLIDNLLSPSTK